MMMMMKYAKGVLYMKKWVAMLLTLVLIVGMLCACGSANNSNNSNSNTENATPTNTPIPETPTPSPTPTPTPIYYFKCDFDSAPEGLLLNQFRRHQIDFGKALRRLAHGKTDDFCKPVEILSDFFGIDLAADFDGAERVQVVHVHLQLLAEEGVHVLDR